MIRKNTWITYTQKQEKEAFAFAEGYKKFLDQGKTERECVDQLVNMAEEEGFVELTSLLEKKMDEQVHCPLSYRRGTDGKRDEHPGRTY